MHYCTNKNIWTCQFMLSWPDFFKLIFFGLWKDYKKFWSNPVFGPYCTHIDWSSRGGLNSRVFPPLCLFRWTGEISQWAAVKPATGRAVTPWIRSTSDSKVLTQVMHFCIGVLRVSTDTGTIKFFFWLMFLLKDMETTTHEDPNGFHDIKCMGKQ